MFIISISISIQPYGQFGQEPESSQATGMALVRCILGKFLGEVCHCYPPRLDVPTFAARWLHVHNDVRYPSSERWNYGRVCCPAILPKWLPRHLRIFYMPQTYVMRPTGRRAEDFLALKIPMVSARFKPANLDTKGQHANHRHHQQWYWYINLAMKLTFQNQTKHICSVIYWTRR
jgi:hypothetical protein